MQLRVLRNTVTNRSTIGEMYVDGDFECYTLEDVVRPVKIPGMTAIPEGTYEVIVTWSARFQRLLPELREVPNFTGVRIHPGNTDADTEGCILVGQSKAADFIGNSRAAFNRLFPRIQAACQAGKVFIEVTSAAASARGLVAAAARGLHPRPPAPARRRLAARPGKPARKAASAPAPRTRKPGTRKAAAKRRPRGAAKTRR